MGDFEKPDVVSARLAAIVDSSDDAIVSKTLDGVVTTWNRAAERIFGYTAAEAIGRNIRLIIPTERLPEEDDVLARLRRGERVDHFDTVRRTKSGELIDVSLTVSPIRSADGTIVGASKIARDVSGRKERERERAQSLIDAEAANRSKDTFLAIFGHELRNPLAAIASAAQIIADARDMQEIMRPVDVIDRQVNHLRRLVDDLMDAARIRMGKISLERAPVNLREAIEHALTVARTGVTGVRHVIEVDAEDVAALADPARLEQIIVNLFTNAVKYTPAGRRIRITARAEHGQAVLRVKDEGIGLAPGSVAKVFDMFMQSDHATPRSQGGLGIGLALVRTLAELHDGSVEASSPGLGRGTTFTVRLPLTEMPGTQTMPAAPIAATRRSVLIVEDNADAGEMLRRYLERRGHEVFVATDGAEGVEVASRVHPEVALVDIGLPLLDGFEVARQIRSQPAQPRQLVALTGFGQPEDRQRCLAAGFDGYLVKPVDPAALSELLER